MFFWNSLAFSMIQQMLAIWSLVPLPFLKPAQTSGSSWFTLLLKPGLENFEHYFTSMWDECSYAVVWTFFGIAFLWNWNENWPFPVLWPLLSFPNFLAYWVQHFNSILIFKLPKFFLWPGSMVSLKFHPLRKIMVWKKLSCQARNLDSPLWQRHAKLRGQMYKDEKV